MKIVNGVPVKGWLYRDDLRIVAELDGTGSVVSRFVWADGAGAEEAAVRTVLDAARAQRAGSVRGSERRAVGRSMRRRTWCGAGTCTGS